MRLNRTLEHFAKGKEKSLLPAPGAPFVLYLERHHKSLAVESDESFARPTP